MLSISERFEWNILQARLRYIEDLLGLQDVRERIKAAVLAGTPVEEPPEGYSLNDLDTTFAFLNAGLQPAPTFNIPPEDMTRLELMRTLKRGNIKFPFTATKAELLRLLGEAGKEAA